MPSTTRRVHRRAAIIHPLAALTLATLVAWLATPTPTRPVWTVLPPVTWLEGSAAVLVVAVLGVVAVRLNRKAA